MDKVDGVKLFHSLDKRYGIKEEWHSKISAFFKKALELENYAREVGYRECCESGYDYLKYQKVAEEKLKCFIEDCFYKRPNLAKDEFFINYDPRGYAIKIEEKRKAIGYRFYEWFYTDWGGYGILIPDNIYFENGVLHKTIETINGKMKW